MQISKNTYHSYIQNSDKIILEVKSFNTAVYLII